MSKSVVLLSGGLDSAVCVFDEVKTGHEVYALTVIYGQRHIIEVDAASQIAHAAGVVEHVTTSVGFDHIEGKLLTDTDGQVWPRTLAEMNNDDISPMYVPFRNAVLLSLAISWAESLKATRVVIGANYDDRRGFPDCRPEFMAAMTLVAQLGTTVKPTVIAPLQNLTKTEVVTWAVELKVPIGTTISCYAPHQKSSNRYTPGEISHCGVCDACVVRRTAFGIHTDPTHYLAGS